MYLLMLMIHDVFKHPYWSNLVDTCMRKYILYGKQLFLRQLRNGPCKITVLYCNLQLSRNLFIPPKFDHLDYLSIFFFIDNLSKVWWYFFVVATTASKVIFHTKEGFHMT